MAVGAQTATAPRITAIARYIDVVIVLVAAAPAIALGAPWLGYVIGAAGWITQRTIQVLDRRLARRVHPDKRLRVLLFEPFGRIWLLAGAIVVAGVVGGRADGLTAAVVVFVAYSIGFAIRIASGPPEPSAP
ncbi:MAG: hypothetical protein ACRDL8_17250 [Solirubrobacteraceae bacterium]